MMSGEATPSQMGGLLMALRVRGETVDEITGAVTAMREKMLRVEAPPDAIDVVGTGGDASGSLQHLDLRGLHRGGRRRAGRQARQPRAVLALRRRRRAGRARGQASSLTPDGVSRCIKRGRHRLHVRARAPSGDEECRPDARRARHPHDLQSARPALQSGRRQTPDGRRVLAAMDRAAGAGAQEPRLRERSGSCTAPTASTRSPPRGRPMSPRSRTARCASSRSRRKMWACRGSSPRRCAAATPKENAQALGDVLKGKKGAFRDVAILNAAAGLIVAGSAKDLKQAVALAAEVGRFRRGRRPAASG